MQRGEREQLLYLVFNVRRYQACIGNVFASVYHTVSDRAYFLRMGYHSYLFVGEQFGHAAESCLMVRYRECLLCFFHFPAAKVLVGDNTFCLAYAFHKSAGDGFAGVHVDKLVLY